MLQTDGRTDGQTDRQTDGQNWYSKSRPDSARYALASVAKTTRHILARVEMTLYTRY